MAIWFIKHVDSRYKLCVKYSTYVNIEIRAGCPNLGHATLDVLSNVGWGPLDCGNRKRKKNPDNGHFPSMIPPPHRTSFIYGQPKYLLCVFCIKYFPFDICIKYSVPISVPRSSISVSRSLNICIKVFWYLYQGLLISVSKSFNICIKVFQYLYQGLSISVSRFKVSQYLYQGLSISVSRSFDICVKVFWYLYQSLLISV